MASRYAKKNFPMMLARMEKGWTQKTLAEKAGTKENYISKIENGIESPSLDMKMRIAKALEAEADKLFPEKNA